MLFNQFLVPLLQSTSYNLYKYLTMIIRFYYFRPVFNHTNISIYIQGISSNSPYTLILHVEVLTLNKYLQNLRWILSISLDLENPGISHA